MSYSKSTKRGRPTLYSEALADDICTRIMQGRSLRKATAELGIDESVVYDWLKRHQSFTKQYACAREWQADVLAEEIVSIADELVIEARYQGEDIKLDVSSTAVQRNRLRVDARKWYASKLAPKKYGDKLDATVTGPGGGPIQHAIRIVIEGV
ncbi:MAG: terminase small subunit protein [Rhodoferax sp.]|nr:terminase small subunit protein [Rhodoferax sp.]